jgi:hypothetical protein
MEGLEEVTLSRDVGSEGDWPSQQERGRRGQVGGHIGGHQQGRW